jgi:BASS family bile acid:Na+ symporter
VRPRDFLGNNAYMMITALVIALALGGFPEAYPRMNKDLAMGALMVMMSFSLCSMSFKGLELRDHARSIRAAFLLSFLLSTGTTIAMAFLFEGDLRSGWVLLAAVPSAVSVIPFTLVLGGDLEGTMVASAVLYILSLVLTPLLTLVLIGHAIGVITLLWYVVMLLLVPVIASRGLRRASIDPYWRSIIINTAFSVLVIAVAGSNRGVFLSEPVLLTTLLAVALVRTFGIGIASDSLLKRWSRPWSDRVPEVLFATHKNTGMAAALAIALIGETAAMPATVCMTVDIVWLIFLGHVMFPRALRPSSRAVT